MKRNIVIVATLAALVCGAFLLSNVARTHKRRFVETRRICELSLREAHPADVLVYLQQEVSKQLPRGESAFLIAPDLMSQLASPIIVLDQEAISNLVSMVGSESSSGSNLTLPSVSLDCTNQTLLSILELMESQRVFRVHAKGEFIVLRAYDNGSQQTGPRDGVPAAHDP